MKTKFLSVLASTAILLASCSNDDATPETTDGQVRFASGISSSNLKVAGADGDQWEGNESIGIYMVNNGLTTIAEIAENVKYTTASTGAAALFSSTTPIFYPVDATQKVDFIAYHPHNAALIDYEYPVDVTTQADQSAIDLMRADNNNTGLGFDKTQGASYIELVFDHKLTKLIFNTKPDIDNGLTQIDLENMTVTIKGLNTKAEYDIATDVLTAASPAIAASILTKTTTAGTLYEAIVVPQSFLDNKVTVEFALNNNKDEVFVYEMPGKTFAEAEKHTFEVKVQRTKVEVRGTISAWESAGTTEGTAK